ncbi:hypothetical protein Ndes2526A_g07548 [Nannochloris sp. 'desiccata']
MFFVRMVTLATERLSQRAETWNFLIRRPSSISWLGSLGFLTPHEYEVHMEHLDAVINGSDELTTCRMTSSMDESPLMGVYITLRMRFAMVDRVFRLGRWFNGASKRSLDAFSHQFVLILYLLDPLYCQITRNYSYGLLGDARSGAVATFDGKNMKELLPGDSLHVRMSPFPVPTINFRDQTLDWFSSIERCFMWNERTEQKEFQMRSGKSAAKVLARLEKEREDSKAAKRKNTKAARAAKTASSVA